MKYMFLTLAVAFGITMDTKLSRASGIAGEWHGEFKRSENGGEGTAVYCSFRIYQSDTIISFDDKSDCTSMYSILRVEEGELYSTSGRAVGYTSGYGFTIQEHDYFFDLEPNELGGLTLKEHDSGTTLSGKLFPR